jgi:hypothetical protein
MKLLVNLFFLVALLLLALALGWHPGATVKSIAGYHSSSTSETDGINRELELERKVMGSHRQE